MVEVYDWVRKGTCRKSVLTRYRKLVGSGLNCREEFVSSKPCRQWFAYAMEL
jgi:hypothetical protein